VNRQQVPSCVDLAALAALSGDDARLAAFRLLSRDEQANAIRRLAATGMSDHGIARATMLSVEQIRIVLANSTQPQRTIVND
jgi:ABC-type phosphate/phosphonate transport system ATPase subunit